jgi:hypothetical protein
LPLVTTFHGLLPLLTRMAQPLHDAHASTAALQFATVVIIEAPQVPEVRGEVS